MTQWVNKPKHPDPETPSRSSRRPDYLLLLMLGLFLLSLLIGLLTDVPALIW